MIEKESFKTTSGEDIFSYEFIKQLRSREADKPTSKYLFAQAGCQEKFLATHADITIFGGSRGGGKGAPYDNVVLTPTGFTRMGDLKVGDKVNSIYGHPQEIIKITELGNVRVYKLFFSDGTSTECTNDHRWSVKKSRSKYAKDVLNWSLWTFDMIKKHIDENNIGDLHIPICEEQRFSTFNHKGQPSISPYIIGVLIGCKCFVNEKTNCIHLKSPEEQIIQELERNNLKFNSTEQHSLKNKDYTYTNKDVVKTFKEFGLLNESIESKIPNDYKLGTIDTRLGFIQGLMDTCGTIDRVGHCTLTIDNFKLVDDIIFILRSIGCCVDSSISIKKSPVGGNNKTYYASIHFVAKHAASMFRIQKKKKLCRPTMNDAHTLTKRIVGYKFVGYKPCRCISVSNVEGLYITNDFIVTHNSFALLVETLKDIYNPYFNAIILREEKPDLENLIDESGKIFEQYGKYNRSKDDMTWNFHTGGKLHFGIYSQSFGDFQKKYQGKQYAYIGIDEITHIPYRKFKYLITDNRNAHGIRNRVYGTCNPDPDSWVRKFIDWWIGDDGYPITERDGVIRYCFMEGNSPNSIIWGDTPEEVYKQCKRTIDGLWKSEYANLGFDKLTMFIKSVCFIYGKLEENIKLLASDPNYIANLAQQDEEQRGRDLGGNWDIRAGGDDIISRTDMETFFSLPMNIESEGRKRVSCDVAFTGGDSLVMWLWNGWHIEDLFVCRNNAKSTVELVKSKLIEWGVREEDMTYDLNGLGQVFKGFFPSALPFNNMAAPLPRNSAEKNVIKSLFGNLKSECAYMFACKLKEGGLSINKDLLDRKYNGDGFEKMPLRQILLRERKSIRQNEESADKSFTLITKKRMKQYVGHSPDYIEAMLMVMIFELKKQKIRKNLWML